MTTMDPAWEALPSFPPDESTPMISQSEGSEAVGDGLSLFESNGSPPKLEREPGPSHAHKFLKGKESVGKALSERSGKLTLLELPMDILRLIVQEVPHTNDLAALALTNSTLHSLAVPNIYSRFDIVWPDSQSAVSDNRSVDALTYGLTTFCLGSKFAHRVSRLRNLSKARTPNARQFRVDHDYAKYTRKFALGNGPDDWVAEYHIYKESGKMLGTLVTLAIEKMVNLESFVWDMPTGVLSDVFLALGSLQDAAPNHETKLDRIWIRLHDSTFLLDPSQNPSRNTTLPAVLPEGTTLTTIGLLPPTPHPDPPPPISYGESTVEYPTFSVLPPLRSLTVLEIDNISYLDEMSMLIGRSQSRLQELRVGIAAKSAHLDFAQAWDGPGLQQVDKSAHWPGECKIGPRRLGGVLGVLLGRVFDLRRRPATTPPSLQNDTLVVTMPIPQGGATASTATSQPSQFQATNGDIADFLPDEELVSESHQSNGHSKTPLNGDKEDTHARLDGKLRLCVLELERVPLSMQVLLKGIDWTTLTTLTLLNCPHQMTLWKLLARHFLPTSSIPGLKGPSAVRNAPHNSLQYHLALKSIHTDIACMPLVKFIKETLAPNTLEVLFLHDRHRVHPPRVTLQKVLRLAVTRHNKSLRKLLFDSADGSAPFHSGSESTRWHHWTPTTEIVLYLTSGKLPQLRELSMTLHASDWHTLLRRLPNVPHLRALDIHHINGKSKLGPTKELAQQLVDIVTLRPESRLCYAGLLKECYEIFEAEPSSHAGGAAETPALDANTLDGSNAASATGDENETASNGSFSDEDDTESEDGTPAGVTGGMDSLSETESALGSDGESLDMEFEGSAREFQARQILFYDEVAIFRARRVKL